MPDITIASNQTVTLSSFQRAAPLPMVLYLGTSLTLATAGAAPCLSELDQYRSQFAVVTTSLAPVESAKDRFQVLADAWRRETATPSSDYTGFITHWAYLRIIAMGPAVVPLILADLACAPDHWGIALTAITGENPIPPDVMGDVSAIADAWLDWGRSRRLVS